MSKQKKADQVDLHELNCELARMDNPENFDACVRTTEQATSALGRKLRSVTPAKALAILAAITERAGLVCLLIMLAGCVGTRFSREVDPVSKVEKTSLDRVALWYDSEFSVEVPGWGTITGYKGDSNAREFMQMIQTGMTLGAAMYAPRPVAPAPAPVAVSTNAPAK